MALTAEQKAIKEVFMETTKQDSPEWSGLAKLGMLSIPCAMLLVSWVMLNDLQQSADPYEMLALSFALLGMKVGPLYLILAAVVTFFTRPPPSVPAWLKRGSTRLF